VERGQSIPSCEGVKKLEHGGSWICFSKRSGRSRKRRPARVETCNASVGRLIQREAALPEKACGTESGGGKGDPCFRVDHRLRPKGRCSREEEREKDERVKKKVDS